MTFETREQSVADGAPIQLIVFALGLKTWRFARSPVDVTSGGNTYTAAAVGFSNVRQSGEIARNDITLRVPRDFPIAELWRVSPPAGTVAVIVKDMHEGETETRDAWLGHIANVSWPDPASAEILLKPGIVAMQATGLRRRQTKNCVHVLYGFGCNLDREDYRTAATVVSNNGLTLEAAEFATFAGKLPGGYIEWVTDDGVTEWRFITDQPTSTTVTLATQAIGLPVGASFDYFRGCRHDLAACDEFGNVPNYGGLPYFTPKNPYDSTGPIY